MNLGYTLVEQWQIHRTRPLKVWWRSKAGQTEGTNAARLRRRWAFGFLLLLLVLLWFFCCLPFPPKKRAIQDIWGASSGSTKLRVVQGHAQPGMCGKCGRTPRTNPKGITGHKQNQSMLWFCLLNQSLNFSDAHIIYIYILEDLTIVRQLRKWLDLPNNDLDSRGATAGGHLWHGSWRNRWDDGLHLGFAQSKTPQ